MKSKVLALTLLVTGGASVPFKLDSADLVLVETSGSDSKITYVNSNGSVSSDIVDETPAVISAAAENLIPLTETSFGTVFYINAGRIVIFSVSGTGSKVEYETPASATFKQIVVNESNAAIQTAINNLAVTEQVQTLTGAGAVNLTQLNTLLVTTGANALTLAAGKEGQDKFIKMKTDGGDGTLTPSALQGGTTIAFNDAGDFVLLKFLDGKWNIIVNSGCTVA